MTAELELRLGRVASLAHRARVTLSRGCFSPLVEDDGLTDICNGNCGGHAAIGWSLDPAEVLAAIAGSPDSVIDLVVDRDRLADQVAVLAAGLRAQVELDNHADCPICDRGKRRCSEASELQKQVVAAHAVLPVPDEGSR